MPGQQTLVQKQILHPAKSRTLQMPTTSSFSQDRKKEKQHNGFVKMNTTSGISKLQAAPNLKMKQTTEHWKKSSGLGEQPINSNALPNERAKTNPITKCNPEKLIKLEEKTKSRQTMRQIPSDCNPLDNILSEIEAFDSANKKKIKEMESEGADEDNEPCSSRQLPPTPVPGPYRPLNKMELARQEQDQEIVHSFLSKSDLMKRILAYKMLRGRVESYSTMSIKIDLNNCEVPDYELKPAEIDENEYTNRSLEFIEKQNIDKQTLQSTTSDPSGLRRGPMTPPGSPDTNISSCERMDEATCNILPEPNSSTHMEENKQTKNGSECLVEEQNVTEAMLKNIGSITGFSTDKIKQLLGNDLHKLDKIKMEDLLSTFLESLKQIADKRGREQNQDCASPTLTKSPIRSSSQLRDENKSIASGEMMKNTVQNTENNFEMDAMEISSQSNGSMNSASFSNGLLPPPPAPPPMLEAFADLVVPPPPPPPLPQISGDNIAEELPAQPSLTQRVLSPPQLTTSESLRQRSFSARKNYSNKWLGPRRPGQKRFAFNGTARKVAQRQRPNERGQGPSSSSTAKRNLKTFSASKKAMVTRACVRPVSLLSLNLTDPSARDNTKNAETKSNRANDAYVSQSHQLCPKQPSSSTKMLNERPKSTRETPFLVDLEFIKNTPPPPIPNIVKKEPFNEKAAVPSFHVPPPLPRMPQSLLHMDFTRPPRMLQPSMYRPSFAPPLAPSQSSVLKTVVRAIGGNLRPPQLQAKKAPTQARTIDSSPYGKFF